MNWQGHGNGPDESGYSPLAQINRDNVSRLTLVWHLEFPGEQTLEGMPRFDDLSREQVRQIHAYIRERDRAALAGDLGINKPTGYHGAK